MSFLKKRGLIPLLVVLGFCSLGVLAQYLPGVTVKALDSAVTNVMPGEKQTSQHLWLVPDSIYDGDTLRVTDGKTETKIRFCGIDAPEKDQPMGIIAHDHLRELVAKGDGGKIIVVPVEKDRYGRTVADLFVPLPDTEEEIHLNSQMVMDGMAYHYERYSNSCPHVEILVKAEAIAKKRSAGVWANPGAEKPWEYRQRN
ncbi:MAG: thermonuclease family protein [Cyanobacteria bacterium P01_D01_bin.56]